MRLSSDIEIRAHQMSYALRAAFFLRQLTAQGAFRHTEAIRALVAGTSSYSWQERMHWGITDMAWEAVREAGIDPLHVFAHPKVLIEHHHLIAYYRNVAVLPDKGVRSILGYSTLPFERDPDHVLVFSKAVDIASIFNSNISTIIEGARELSAERLAGLMFASAGASIDGSWRNKVGDDAELIVQSYLMRLAIEEGAIVGLIDAKGHPAEFDEKYDYVGNVEQFKGIKLTNGRTVIFASEPDISLIDEVGRPLSAIEVKGGRDRAGALERLGAITKSFRACRAENPDCVTIAVIGVITQEMQTRLDEEDLVNEVYDLTRMIYDPDYKKRFLEFIAHRWLR